jgi:hypothetical protein
MEIHPRRTDIGPFKSIYQNLYVPLAFVKPDGKAEFVATKVLTSPQGIPPFYRIAEIHFSLMQDFEVCAALDRGKQLVAEAVLISSGGPPIFSMSGEETFNSSKWPVFTSRRMRGPIWPIRCDSAYVSEIGQSAKPNWTKQTTEETKLYD